MHTQSLRIRTLSLSCSCTEYAHSNRLLYGRDKEVQQVKKLSSQVRKARVSALFIRGDPGSGKSSFMRLLPAVVDGKPLFGRGRFEQVRLRYPSLSAPHISAPRTPDVHAHGCPNRARYRARRPSKRSARLSPPPSSAYWPWTRR